MPLLVNAGKKGNCAVCEEKGHFKEVTQTKHTTHVRPTISLLVEALDVYPSDITW